MNEHFYETGSTQPPKSRILIVLLLVLLIFTGGIITALGLLNIRLLGGFSLGKEESVPLQFTREEHGAFTDASVPQPAQTAPNTSLGVATETVSAFIRAYYSLPAGVYIPRVPPGSPADAAGIMPGDILLAVDGQKITDTETLNNLLRRYRAGDVVTLTLHREGQKRSVKLTLTEETG